MKVCRKIAVIHCRNRGLLSRCHNAAIANRHFKRPLGILEKGAYGDVILLDYDPPTPLTTETFLGQENQRHGLHVRGLTRAAEQMLMEHDWPGNVRELRNIISSAAVMKQRGLIDQEDLPVELRLGPGPRQAGYLPVPLNDTQNIPGLDLALLATTMLELRVTSTSMPVLTTGTSVRSSGTACFCMLEPISARFASLCSRKGMRLAETPTSCLGETSA